MCGSYFTFSGFILFVLLYFEIIINMRLCKQLKDILCKFFNVCVSELCAKELLRVPSVGCFTHRMLLWHTATPTEDGVTTHQQTGAIWKHTENTRYKVGSDQKPFIRRASLAEPTSGVSQRASEWSSDIKRRENKNAHSNEHDELFIFPPPDDRHIKLQLSWQAQRLISQ